jgi:hypothetical protein
MMQANIREKWFWSQSSIRWQHRTVCAGGLSACGIRSSSFLQSAAILFIYLVTGARHERTQQQAGSERRAARVGQSVRQLF